MGQPVILLGAGASKDAGLPDTYELTTQVYEDLGRPGFDLHRKLFGYVIAKLLARGVRAGRSPFDKINIEEAYDGLARLLDRDADLLSDFVYSWDPILDTLKAPFDSRRFQKIMGGLLTTSRRLGGGERVAIDGRHSRALAEQLSRAINGDARISNREDLLAPFVDALAGRLAPEPIEIDYLERLTAYAGENALALATLNYDTYVDDCAERQGLKIDYGLSHWNSKKIVQWTKGDMRIIKLHGSLNWRGKGEDIIINPTEDAINHSRMMIFGGLNAKLNPDGPYLQLRHQFETILLKTNILIIIGYSFRDTHMNAIIRRWVSSRRKAKLIIVDPESLQLTRDQVGYPFVRGKDGKPRRTVEFHHLQLFAKDSIAGVIESANKEPDLSSG